MSSEFVNSQDMLWSFVGPWFWRGYATVCAFGGLLWFKFILSSHARDALTVARLTMLGGFILGAFVRMNSACEPLSGALLATGAAMSALLISSNWCGRRGTAREKLKALLHETVGWKCREYGPPQGD